MTDSILRTFQRSVQSIIVPYTQVINLWQKSQAFDASAWGTFNVTIAGDAVTAPDGTATAEQATTTAVGAAIFPGAVSFRPAVAPGTYTSSIFLKPITTAQWMRTVYNIGGNAASAWFDILNGTAGTISATGAWSAVSSSVQAAGNGFFRCIFTFSISEVGNTDFNLIAQDGNGSTGGSASGTSYGLWGVQLQVGSIATSYVANL